MYKTILTPLSHDLAQATATDDKRVFWKQVLPLDDITYEGEKIDFNDTYMSEVIDSFKRGAIPQVPLQLADKDNSHTMAIERQGGVITDLRREGKGESPGLYAKIEASKPVAKLIKSYPKIGVSCRIRPDHTRVDGEHFGQTLVHVLATNDPKVVKLSDWKQAADFSEYASEDVIDLSSLNYSEAAVSKKSTGTLDLATKAIADFTDEDFAALTDDVIADFSDERLAEFLDVLAEEGGTVIDAGDGAPAGDVIVPTKTEPQLSNKDKQDITLANATAKSASDKATRLERKLADSEWEKTQERLLARGIPAHCIELAEPVLHRSEAMVVDLSNSGGEADVDITDIVLSLLDELEGTVDLSAETGHGGARDASDATKASVKSYRENFGL
jgi:hypothetical protein